MILWQRAFCRRSSTVRFRLADGLALGKSDQVTRRALAGMERAGLVKVVRPPGRSMEVTILPAPVLGGRPQ